MAVEREELAAETYAQLLRRARHLPEIGLAAERALPPGRELLEDRRSGRVSRAEFTSA
jgi:hypothetical protein